MKGDTYARRALHHERKINRDTGARPRNTLVYIAANNVTDGERLLMEFLEDADDADSDFEPFEAEAELKRLQQSRPGTPEK